MSGSPTIKMWQNRFNKWFGRSTATTTRHKPPVEKHEHYGLCVITGIVTVALVGAIANMNSTGNMFSAVGHWLKPVYTVASADYIKWAVGRADDPVCAQTQVRDASAIRHITGKPMRIMDIDRAVNQCAESLVLKEQIQAQQIIDQRQIADQQKTVGGTK